MVRSLYNPKTGRLRDFPLSTTDGGTGANNGPDALANLSAVPASKKDVANGIAILGADLKVKPENIPSGIVTGPTVMGPLETYEGQPSTHVITNYDILATYTVTAVTGTVSVVKDTITYTAPLSAGSGGFYINGKLFAIDIKPSALTQPVILSPTYPTDNRPSSITITASESTGQGYVGYHISTSWQLATDLAFTNIVQESLNDTVNLTNWTVSNLTKNTTYFVRCKNTESLIGISSPWSNPVSFETRHSFYPDIEVSKIVADDPVENDGFGWRVAMSLDGNYIAVGASHKNSYRGAVYVYVKSGTSWVFQVKLLGTYTVANDYFGWSVAINQDGSLIAVGCYSNKDGVYIYRRDGTIWNESPRILPPPAGDGVTRLGHAIALSYDGAILAIGCYNRTVTYASQGTIYFYCRNSTDNNWTLRETYSNPAGLANDMLGCSVNFIGKSYNLVAGSFGKYNETIDCGVICKLTMKNVVDGNGAIVTLQVESAAYKNLSPINQRERYACEVSAYAESDTKTYAVVGNFSALDPLNKVRGLVSIVDLNVMATVQTFLPDEIMVDGLFGRSVAMCGTGAVFVVGTEYQTDTLTGQGSAYFYALENGSYVQKAVVHPSDTAAGDHFGISVAISDDGGAAVVGAWLKTGTVPNQGAIYLYD